MALNKRSKAGADRKRDGQKENPVEEPAAVKRPASKKLVAKKTAVKKSGVKKSAVNHEEVAIHTAVGKKAPAVKGKKKVAAQRAAGRRQPGRRPGKQRTIPLSEGSEPGTAEAAELDPFEVAKQTVRGAVPAIVEAIVEQAMQGSCTHAKTLLEMTGAKHMFGDETELQDSGEPWAKLVLERMDEAEQKDLQGAPQEVAAEP